MLSRFLSIMNNPLASSSSMKAYPGKRKAIEPDESKEPKKPRKEGNPKSRNAAKKTLLHGEEQRGGLVIVRSIIPTPSHEPAPATLSKPSSSLRATASPNDSSSALQSQRFIHLGKPQSKGSLEVNRSNFLSEDRQVEEEVRHMEEELSHLKDTSLSHARNASASNVNLKFPSSLSKASSAPSTTSEADGFYPIPTSETPLNKKNKQFRMREGRRSSTSMRGKRLSSSLGNSGVITQPHLTVPSSTFYKHLDPELPDALRLRHLLIWCATRTVNTLATSSSSRTAPLPPLSQQGLAVLNQVQNTLLQFLAGGKIETPVSTSLHISSTNEQLKEHEQNVKNRRREDAFLKDIDRARSEDTAWAEIIRSYNTRQSSCIANLENRSQSRKSTKGKEKEEDSWNPWENELDESWISDLTLAQEILSRHQGGVNVVAQSPLSRRMGDIEYQVDLLHENVHVSSQLALQSSRDLDARFARLSSALQFRSQRPPGHGDRLTQIDARELLRTIAQTDLDRPEGAGEAARQAAREVKRVEGGPSQTITPLPSTPRTPRRAGALSKRNRH